MNQMLRAAVVQFRIKSFATTLVTTMIGSLTGGHAPVRVRFDGIAV